ncbi:MAG: HAD hydrolase family protein [Candidatus Aureabacteria bacterium]|nr:HAD hydrolase family protein [Candidatus Auribacterota bacterium]
MKKADIIRRARLIRAIVADVDGVLTDGGIVYGSHRSEFKRFHVHDGLAVALARRSGLKVLLVSARASQALLRRSREMGVNRLWQGLSAKGRIFGILQREFKLRPHQICAIGDDLPDLPLLEKAGLAVAVPRAAEEVRRVASLVTKRGGGEGALREVIELVLKAQGRWKDAVNAYRD